MFHVEHSRTCGTRRPDSNRGGRTSRGLGKNHTAIFASAAGALRITGLVPLLILVGMAPSAAEVFDDHNPGWNKSWSPPPLQYVLYEVQETPSVSKWDMARAVDEVAKAWNDANSHLEFSTERGDFAEISVEWLATHPDGWVVACGVDAEQDRCIVRVALFKEVGNAQGYQYPPEAVKGSLYAAMNAAFQASGGNPNGTVPFYTVPDSPPFTCLTPFGDQCREGPLPEPFTDECWEAGGDNHCPAATLSKAAPAAPDTANVTEAVPHAPLNGTQAAPVQAPEPETAVEPVQEPVPERSPEPARRDAPALAGDTPRGYLVVTKIVDGDTLDFDNVRIRVVLVDTPERNEPGYREATDFTRSLCPVGSKATVDIDEEQYYDRHGRLLGEVFCNGRSLNALLVEKGYARVFTQFCSASEFESREWAAGACGVPVKKAPMYRNTVQDYGDHGDRIIGLSIANVCLTGPCG